MRFVPTAPCYNEHFFVVMLCTTAKHIFFSYNAFAFLHCQLAEGVLPTTADIDRVVKFQQWGSKNPKATERDIRKRAIEGLRKTTGRTPEIPDEINRIESDFFTNVDDSLCTFISDLAFIWQ